MFNISNAINQGLNQLPVPVTPELRNQLMTALTNDISNLPPNSTVTITVAIEQLRNNVNQGTAKSFDNASSAATAELSPALTNKKPTQKQPTSRVSPSGEGGGEGGGENEDENAPTEKNETDENAPTEKINPPAGNRQQKGVRHDFFSNVSESAPTEPINKPTATDKPDTAAEDAVTEKSPAPAGTSGLPSAQPSTSETPPSPAQPAPQQNKPAQPNVGKQGNQPSGLKQRLAMKAAEALSSKLANQLKNGVIQNLGLILGIALAKDAIDAGMLFVGDPGITGMFIDVFAKVSFTFLLMNQKSTFKGRLLKRYLPRILLAICIEFSPFDFIPTYTIDVASIYISNELTQRREKKHLKAAQELEKKLKKKGLSSSSVQQSHEQINDINQQTNN